MSRQIEQALLSLMPSHGSELPPSLVELAASLLAQSRHRASTLKADEEIARQYACANIACDRLKITLDLPPIEPRPPIPPRIYKRLYTHLDNILPNPSNTPRSGRTRTPTSKRDTGTPTKSRPLPSRETPTKEAALASFRPKDDKTAKKDEAKVNPAAERVYPWIQPVIRHMCASSDHKRLAPTMLAGVEHIVTPDGRPTEDEWVHKHITSLMAAIYFFVTMRVRAIASGEDADIDRDSYVPLRKEMLALVNGARQQVPSRDVDDNVAWNGWEEVKPREFDAAVARINEEEWLAADWYDGIADVLNATAKTDAEMPDEDGADVEAPLPSRRADTMLQDRYDYLSDAKVAAYESWKAGILAKISQAVPRGAMDVDV